MKFITIALLSLALISCSETNDTRFSEEKDNQSYTVIYEIFNTLENVKKRYNEVWDTQTKVVIKKTNKDMYGFSYFKGNKCIIVMAVSSAYTLRELEKTLGHEHLHCRYGAWHK